MFKLLFKLFAVLTVVIAVLGALLYRADVNVEHLKPKYANEHSKFMQLDGMNVHYRDEGQGPVIVLLHGIASSLQAWDGWAEELKKSYRVIRLDLPGFGLTGPDHNNNYSTDYYVDFLNRFINKLDVKEFVLAGNSLGGRIAWEYTLINQYRVRKLILIDASGYPQDDYSLVFTLASTPIVKDIMPYLTPRFYIKSNIDEVYGNDKKVSEKLVDRYYDLTLRAGNRTAFIARVNTKNKDHSGLIGNINIPTLIMWGGEDRWIPVKYAHRFNNEILGSKLIIYNGVGHVPMEESPKLTVIDAINFIKGK